MYDIVIVGSGPAGCTAAILLAQSGRKVALLEAHRDPETYKRLCTHAIQSSAVPVLQRLGLDAEIEAAGGRRTQINLWTRFGWIHEGGTVSRPAFGYNVRRQTLDPLMRSKAAATPNVDLFYGVKAQELLRDVDGRVVGVRATVGGESQEFSARLVVGADGKNSKIATWAGLTGRESPNNRFGYFAHFHGVTITGGRTSQMWMTEPDVAYAFANDAGVTVLAAMPGKERLDRFTNNREAALLDVFRTLPDAPDVSSAVRVSEVTGTRDYPTITRRRITAPGVALIGDMTGDPLWGVGCGWAMQSASWLADAIARDPRAAAHSATAHTDKSATDSATTRYMRVHRRRLRPHQFLAADFSTGRPFNALERLLYEGAVHDPRVADAFAAFGTRNSSPAVLVHPRTLLRAARSRRRARRLAHSA